MMDVVVLLDGKVGRHAELFDLVERAGVEVVASCVFPRLGGSVAHLAVPEEDYDGLEDLLTRHLGGIADQRPCIVIPPGYSRRMAEISRRIAEEGLVVSVAYHGDDGSLVLATSDVALTRRALGLE